MIGPRLLPLALTLMVALPGVAAARSNLLLISIDTLRADRLGCYGYAKASTPAIDRLASESVRFERAFSPVPLTLPAHCSLLTGTYPIHHGVRDNSGFVLPPSASTLAEVLQAEGYRTGAFVGAFVLDSKFGLDQGFDRYFDDFDLSGLETVNPGYVQRRGDEVVEEASSWLKSGDGRPFFAWVHLFDPHDPYTPPEPFASAHAGRPYDGEIAFTDHVVGKLLDTLRGMGRYRDTVIVLVGDHGESLGDHREQRHGLFVYNATQHVPLLIRLPGGESAGKTSPEPVSLVDVAPTLLQLLEVDRRRMPHAQGRALGSVLLGKTRPSAADLYAESHYGYRQFGWSPLRALYSGGYKYIEAPTPELYDLRSDFGEQHNLAAENQALTSRLRQRLSTFEQKFAGASDAASPATPDAETLRKLQALGYVATAGAAAPADGADLPDPKDQIGLYNRITDLFEASSQGRLDEAIEGYREVLETQPNLKVVWHKLGQAYFDRGELQPALESFQRALQLGGGESASTFSLAQTYLRLGRLEEARLGFERAVEIDPEHYRARINLGVIYRNQNRLSDAITQFEKALETAPDSPLVLGNLGVAYAQAGQGERGIQVLERAVQLSPEDARLHANLGSALMMLGREEEGRRWLEKARQLDPGLFRRP